MRGVGGSTKKVFWRAGAAFLIWASSIISLLAASTLLLLNYRLGIVVSEVVIAIPPLAYLILKGGDLESLGFKRESVVKDILLGCIVAPLSALVGFLINLTSFSLLPPPPWYLEALERMVPTTLFDLSFLLIVTVFVIGPCEELLCRGFIQQGLEASYGRRRGLLISAILFAVIHLSPWQFLALVVQGVILGFLFQVRKYSLWSPIGAHIAIDFIFFIVNFVFRLS